jgi:hypothetical protein
MDRHRPDAEKGTKVGERDLSMLSAVSLFFLDVCLIICVSFGRLLVCSSTCLVKSCHSRVSHDEYCF